ncbi:YqiJ family protein [uncultured Microbulbifer sp.]|uniref:YqiJ family protein n=1 Tax=uncultured Microbulbifer sp. TaxID=348147 RepID=UPI002601C8E5|nr:YqiJ family protein [uncultured Microbulbifer sp.]
MEFFLQDGNQLFTGALVLMLMIALLEGVMMLIGVGLSDLLDNLLPDIDLNGGMPDSGPSAGLTKLLGWLRFGEVPALILLVAFLVSFGITGLLIQMVAEGLLGALIPTWILVIPVLFLALPQVRLFGRMLRYFALGDETQAVERNSFAGRQAVITIGEAAVGSPAEARFKDEFGTTHYVMVEPYDEGELFSQGQQVVLVEEQGASFRAIRPAG